MRRRAPKVWAELATSAVHCGYRDPFLRALATAATSDPEARTAALEQALELDPFAEQRCPSGASLAASQSATQAIRACGLRTPERGWQDIIDAPTYLAIRAVELRWIAMGLDRGDHRILLSTLILASSLAAESQRRATGP